MLDGVGGREGAIQVCGPIVLPEVGELLRVLERFGQIGLLWLGPWNVIHAWNLRNLATVYRYGGDVHFAAFQLGRQLPFILCRLTIAGKPR